MEKGVTSPQNLAFTPKNHSYTKQRGCPGWGIPESKFPRWGESHSHQTVIGVQM